MLLLISAALAATSCRTPFHQCALPSAAAASAPRARLATMLASRPATASQNLIDALLAEDVAERLPSLMSRNIDTLTDGGFMAELEARRAATRDERERDRISLVTELVLTFLEELAGRVQQLEPDVRAAQAEAEEVSAAVASTAAKAAKAGLPARRSQPNDALATEPAQSAARSDSPENRPTYSPEKLQREERAKHRFLVEKLLDAAQTGVERLEALLRDVSDDLDPAFFAHLKWEVDEQRAAGNRRMLEILEVVVQRACVEVEQRQPAEVALLSALLQTKNALARREMYERQLVPLPAHTHTAFDQLVCDTQLELEKAVLRGEQVDGSLLQQLRVIRLEVTDHIGSLEQP